VSYRVFARKYRPQTFDEVVGQQHITRTLQNAIEQNRLAQAYLFVGPRGIGKTSTARILAKALNCEKGPTIHPCGKCDACREIAEGNSLDVLEIDGASNNSVEHVRELRENAAYQPARGPYKIYLVDEVHMLSTAAFNALLKTLEEPPPHVKFIFATTEAQKVPATITSRCQRFDLRRIPAPLIAAHLQHIAKNENVTLEPEAAETVAKGADGGLRDAESMLDQLVAFCGDRITKEDVLSVFGFTPKETVQALCEHVFAQDAAGALAIVEEQAEAGKDLSRLMADVIAHLRDLLVHSVAKGTEPAVSRDRLLTLLDHFSEAESRLRWASDRRLYFDVAVIKAVHLLGEATLGEVIDTLAAIGNGEPPPARPVSRPSVQPPPPRVVRESAPEKATPPKAERATEPAPGPAPSAPPAPPPPAAVEPSAPVAGSPKSEPEASQSGDEEVAWRSVAEKLVAESPIRFGWLKDGRFAGFDGQRVTVRFPASYQEHTESLFWDEVRKHVNEVLAAKFGNGTTIDCVFTSDLAEPEPEVPQPGEPVEEEPVAEVPPEPQPDPIEEFRNDPLIRKALEIFKAEIETT